MKKVRLTTIDNPYDPFDEFDSWYAFDERHGYHTSAFLARLTLSSEELSDSDRELSNELTINEIVSENVSGIYKRVVREFADSE